MSVDIAGFLKTEKLKEITSIDHGQSGWKTTYYTDGIVVNYYPNGLPVITGTPGAKLNAIKGAWGKFLELHREKA